MSVSVIYLCTAANITFLSCDRLDMPYKKVWRLKFTRGATVLCNVILWIAWSWHHHSRKQNIHMLVPLTYYSANDKDIMPNTMLYVMILFFYCIIIKLISHSILYSHFAVKLCFPFRNPPHSCIQTNVLNILVDNRYAICTVTNKSQTEFSHTIMSWYETRQK